MILAIDTSTGACSAALLSEAGALIDARDEPIGRGHAERLVPMIDELLAGRRPDRLLVGCGPGSFTGIRVGLAAAHGLAIGWGAPLGGMSSLALLAAGAGPAESVAAAMDGGHGELFIQSFGCNPLRTLGSAVSLPPGRAAAIATAELVVGPAAASLVEARGWGTAVPAFPRAADAARLPPAMRDLPARPIYARAPDARPRAAA